MSLLAVHISDGVLSPAFLAVGFGLAALLLLPALVRVREEEIPRIGLLTAAFFVATLIHVRVGVTSVHLLLNGLLGVVLGRRAPLAVVVALALQAFLLGHGGLTALGVNAVVISVPALAARVLFQAWTFRRAGRAGVAFAAGAAAGAMAVVLTAALNAAVLWVAGAEDFRLVATVGFAVHLPLAVVEGLIVGVSAGYLARVKPEMLRPTLPEVAGDDPTR